MRLQAARPKRPYLGAVLHLLGEFDAALEAHAQAIRLAPREAQPSVNRGWSLVAMNRLDVAA
jgi:Flp pilus assembly protein TadD